MKKNKLLIIILSIHLLTILIFALFILEKNYFAITTTLSKEHLGLVWHGSRDEKVIALTFDDGPNPKYTPLILDILKEYNIRATFFVLGKHALKYPELIEREMLENHEIGNHTFNHINPVQCSPTEFEKEFTLTQEVIFSTIEVMPRLFRPPYGNYNEKVVEIVENQGAKVVIWSTHQDSKDWSNPGVNEIVKTIVSETRNGDIILLHDHVEHDKSDTVESLKIIIPKLKEKGYKFVTVSQLIEINSN